MINFQVLDATDYTKRKHVFKLVSTNGQTEILMQVENESQKREWRDLLQALADRHPKKVRNHYFCSAVELGELYAIVGVRWC